MHPSSSTNTLLSNLRELRLIGNAPLAKISCAPRLSQLVSAPSHSYSCISTTSNLPVRTYAADYASTHIGSRFLGIGDEEGKIHILNTDENLHAMTPACRFSAHQNAIFDIQWHPTLPRICTASGDHCAMIWDVETGSPLSLLSAHSSTVRSVQFCAMDPHLLVTGARDGHVIVWDLRITGVRRPREDDETRVRRNQGKVGTPRQRRRGPGGGGRGGGGGGGDRRHPSSSLAFPSFLPRHEGGRWSGNEGRDFNEGMDVDEEQDAWGSHDASQGELGFERKAYGAANLIRHAHRTSQVHPVVSVVSVVFKNPRFVISAGAYDGQLRGWDLRHHGSYHHQPFPIPTLQSVDFTKTSRRHFGLRHMVMSKDHLYVLGMNGKLYEVHSTLFQPTTLYTSSLYLSPTHYTKLSVDPLGRFLAVGSQFPLCLIMELSTRRTFVLDQGYQSEVTQVCFSKKTTSLDLATCSDDATVRIWKEKQLETTSSLSFEPTSMPSSSLSSPSPYASHLASSAWPYHAREVPAEFESNPFQVPSSATFFSTKDKTFQNQNHGSASIQKQRKTTLHEFFS